MFPLFPQVFRMILVAKRHAVLYEYVVDVFCMNDLFIVLPMPDYFLLLHMLYQMI